MIDDAGTFLWIFSNPRERPLGGLHMSNQSSDACIPDYNDFAALFQKLQLKTRKSVSEDNVMLRRNYGVGAK